NLQDIQMFLQKHIASRFVVLGGISTLCNYILFLLFYILGVFYIIASAAGYLFGAIVGYSLQRWVFRKGEEISALQRTKYLLVYSGSMMVGIIFLWLAVQMGVPVLLANVGSIMLSACTNFMGQRYFIFRKDLFKSRINFLLYRYKYLLRYVAIGLGSIIVEILVIGLIEGLAAFIGGQVPRYIAVGTGFLSGVLFSFALNATINFPVPKNRNLRTFRIFLIISVFAFFLNLGVMKYLLGTFNFKDYNMMRFITAAIVFLVSYSLHRRFTFIDVKYIGIAIYVKASEDVEAIKQKIRFFPDFIHLDLVDATYNKNAEEVDIEKAKIAAIEWPYTKKMIHIMSKKPRMWIPHLEKYVDVIVFHAEIEENVKDVIAMCRRFRKKVGICILHDTPLESIIPYLSKVDVVQVLGIPRPGESSQHMTEEALEKVAALNNLKRKYGFDICFDGGVKFTNIQKINAKYVVSASTILNAEDPIKAIYDLKTSSRYYLKDQYDLRKFLDKEIKKILGGLHNIISGTLVGSFGPDSALNSISDIDMVIIVPKINKEVFTEIINCFKSLESVLKVDYNHKLIINASFGPLKFHDKNTVVLHVMIYDRKEHINHCKKSPFTCLDWQLSKDYIKEHISAVWRVTVLQPNFFFNARRGVDDYLQDITAGTISYREYEFQGKKVSMQKHAKPMNDKDRFEFSYHIIKFCMLNSLKLYYQENKKYPLDSLITHFFRIFPNNRGQHIALVTSFARAKLEGKYPTFTLQHQKKLEHFLTDFKEQFIQYFDVGATKLYFIRHQETILNKPGVFLGQRRDPSIKQIPTDKIKQFREFIQEKKIIHYYASGLRRTMETLAPLEDSMHQMVMVDNRLLEINYGRAEGMVLADIQKRFPGLMRGWQEKKDPRFPDGESMDDVLVRLQSFLEDAAKKGGNALVCTHNVVLRCLVGKLWNIPPHQWYLIQIPHMDPMEVIITKNKKYYLNLSDEQRENYFKGVAFGKEL
ncbi:histidine phosphatase family protein, partial [Candidatus Woesearchaeota archaeon]|nr:histidine phosphatase family protein [Candidatus Woesearchaeota archaeon]